MCNLISFYHFLAISLFFLFSLYSSYVSNGLLPCCEKSVIWKSGHCGEVALILPSNLVQLTGNSWYRFGLVPFVLHYSVQSCITQTVTSNGFIGNKVIIISATQKVAEFPYFTTLSITSLTFIHITHLTFLEKYIMSSDIHNITEHYS